MAGAPILVTGMHRSGTTWVGRMLCAGGEATYVSEPLNPLRPGTRLLPVRHRYTYVHPGNEAEFLPAYRDLVRLRAAPRAELAQARTPLDVVRTCYRTGQLLVGRLMHRRPLLKDPYAVFSAEWFADRLACRVVVVVRHPAAVVSSLKRLGWRAPLASLEAQAELVRDWLDPFREELRAAREHADRRRDLVWSNAVLWRMVYSSVAVYARRRRDVLVVKHEDLSRDPLGTYGRLYRELGLDVNDRARAKIWSSSRAGNPGELDVGRPHSVRLDSRANLANWRRRLSPAEVRTIRELTGSVASRWYGEADWS
jgi:Sulfotransferase family